MKKFHVLFLVGILIQSLQTRAQSALEFIENQGQWGGPFLYKATTGNGDIFLENNGFTFLLGDQDNLKNLHAAKHSSNKPAVLKFHTYRVRFEGAGTPQAVKASKRQNNYYNYFYGNDPAKWKSGIHPHLAIDYKNLYNNVDLHVSSDRGAMKYDFIVNPGGNVADIALSFEGADGLAVEKGILQVKTSIGTVREMPPYAYQYTDNGKVEVPCRYALKGNKITFVLPKGYDASKPLIIDPTVVFATFTGSTADNWGFTATYDAQGNFYAGGIVHHFTPTQSATPGSYPTTTGAFQVTYGGGSSTNGSLYECDMSITKFNSAGTALIYSTYMGGVDNDQPHSLIVDNAGNLIIAGRTYSSNFPVTGNAFDNTYNGAGDMVVVKLNAGGTALIGSTFIGGSGGDGINFDAEEFVFGELKHNYGDDARSEVILDKNNNIYVAASTFSTNFPTSANAYQSSLINSSQDAVVFKFNANLTNLIYSTYLGGDSSDAAYVLALDTAQTHLFVGGGTMSNNFPTTGGTLWPVYQGGSADGYIAKFLNSGSYPLQKLTFIGRTDYDQVYGLQIDYKNNVYAMGQTLGGTFPVTGGVYSNPNSSQFVIRLDSNLVNNQLSTVYGSGTSTETNISPVAFLIDTCENIYISGWGGNIVTPPLIPPANTGDVFNMPVTANATQPTTDGSDFYFIVFTKDAQNLLYGTYAGTNGGVCEHVDGGTSRFDKNGIVYQAICGACGGGTYPTTAGSWATANGSINCNLVALKIAFQFGNPLAQAIAGPDTSGCPPFTVTFTNSSANAANFEWDFDDGSGTTTVVSPTHTFNDPGTYHVRLVANNPGGCSSTSDTTIITIVVDTNSIKADFTYEIIDSCGPFTATITNTSQYGNPPAPTSFQWSFGDGTSSSAVNPGLHSYPDTGCYTVRLIMTDTTTCNRIDTVEKVICIQSFKVSAAFNCPDSICLGTTALMSNFSDNALTTDWTFGDGGTSPGNSPIYTYADTGTYTITLISSNPGSCNKSDTATRTIRVMSQPVADFIYEPLVPITNEPYHFTNQSLRATSYFWAFGDGESSTEVHPVHQYNQSGTYTVCLQAKNASGCVDTICKTLEADVTPAIGVPTAFSPNGDGENDILFVRGAAVRTVDFQVFNRFGELVFETKDMKKGWDGAYKGKLQEMEAYAWVLKATFINNESVSLTGNVTLLR